MNLYRLLFFVTLAVRVSSTDLEADSLFSRRSIQEVGVESHSDRHGHHQSTLSARVNANANAIDVDDGPNHHHQPSSHDIELRPYGTVARPHYPVTHPSPIHPSHRVQFSDSASLPPNYESVALTGPPPYSEPTSGYVNAVGHAWPGEVHEQDSDTVNVVSKKLEYRHDGHHRSTLSARVNGDPNPSHGDRPSNDIELPPYPSANRTPSRPNSPVTHPSPVHLPNGQGLRGSQSSYPSESLPPSYEDSALPAPAAVHHNSPPAAEGHHVVPMSTGERLRPPSSLPPPYSPGRSSYVNAVSQTDTNHPSPLDHDQEEAGPHAQNSGLAPPSPEEVIAADGKMHQLGGNAKHTKRDVLKSVYRPRL
ncbi:hypothetical protein EV360DRAFT_84793 [Lentinula raphanica]|nr:hypothetical protein EV360DRAFT_84793 [Lentinula raphanica]